MDTNNEHFFRGLLEALPLYAEEDHIFEVLSESKIIPVIKQYVDSSFCVETALSIIRCILSSLSLLDPVKLKDDEWAFISFPASLLARSILETMANDNKTFFSSSYWAQDSSTPEKNIEQQRQLIKKLENKRVSDTKNDYSTIRTVHVAWGLIRFGSKFIMIGRDDKERPGIPGYGFPGGRLNLKDLPEEKRKSTSLRNLYQIDSDLAINAMSDTLIRELEEELDLKPGDYKLKFIQTLQPYRKIEGLKNNHAYTQYKIAIYSIQLNKWKELEILGKSVDDLENIKWFTLEELQNGKQADDKKVFIDALLEDTSISLKQLHDKVSDSSSPLKHNNDSESIDLPSSLSDVTLKGKTGKQAKYDIKLDKKEWELLMLLAWHSKNLEITHDKTKLIQLSAGWIKINNDDLNKIAISLSKKFATKSLNLVDYDERGFCRLSIISDYLYFKPEFFTYYWDFESDEKPIVLTLNSIQTKFGLLNEQNMSIHITGKIIEAMPIIEKELEFDELTVKKETLQRQFPNYFERAKEIGLRQFISFKKDWYEVLVTNSQT